MFDELNISLSCMFQPRSTHLQLHVRARMCLDMFVSFAMKACARYELCFEEGPRAGGGFFFDNQAHVEWNLTCCMLYAIYASRTAYRRSIRASRIHSSAELAIILFGFLSYCFRGYSLGSLSDAG